MTKKADKQLERTIKSNEMLLAIQNESVNILFLTREALRLFPGTKQDRIVGQIADATEEIERLYSSNWH